MGGDEDVGGGEFFEGGGEGDFPVFGEVGEGLGEEVLDGFGGGESQSAVRKRLEKPRSILEGCGFGGGVLGEDAVALEGGEGL